MRVPLRRFLFDLWLNEGISYGFGTFGSGVCLSLWIDEEDDYSMKKIEDIVAEILKNYPKVLNGGWKSEADGSSFYMLDVSGV